MFGNLMVRNFITSIHWKERLIACTIHFLVTLLIAAISASIIFFVWFSDTLASIMGGKELFMLVVACDLLLGPVISLVIFDSRKSKKNLVFDYTVIGAVQLAALMYGVSVVAASRPVFVAFNVDRLEIATAFEIEDSDLAAGIEEQFQTKSWLGPRLVFILQPTNIKEKNDLLFSSLAGKSGSLMPKYYRAYSSAREQILNRSRTLDILLKDSGEMRMEIEAAIAQTGKKDQDLRWLLVQHRFGFAVALTDAQTGEPIKYVAIDPTWLSI